MMLVLNTAPEKTPQYLEYGESSGWFRLAMIELPTMLNAITAIQITSYRRDIDTFPSRASVAAERSTTNITTRSGCGCAHVVPGGPKAYMTKNAK